MFDSDAELTHICIFNGATAASGGMLSPYNKQHF